MPDEDLAVRARRSPVADVAHERVIDLSQKWQFERALRLRLHKNDSLLTPANVVEAKAADSRQPLLPHRRRRPDVTKAAPK